MDLSGFGAGILEKIEEDWGRFARRCLTALIGLGVSALCIGLIWQWIVAPVLALLRTPLWGTTITELLFVALAIGLGAALSFSIGLEIAHVRSVRKTKKLLDRAEKTHAQTARLHAEHKESLENVLGDASAMLEDAIETSRRTGELYQTAKGIVREVVEAHPGMSEMQRDELLAHLEQLEDDEDRMA